MKKQSKQEKKSKEIRKLKPSQRPKKRYIKFSLSGAEISSKDKLQNLLWLGLVQEAGVSEAKKFFIKVIEFKQGKGIVRCALEKAEDLRKILPKINEVEDKKVKIKTIKTSGTLKKLRGYGGHRHKKILGN